MSLPKIILERSSGGATYICIGNERECVLDGWPQEHRLRKAIKKVIHIHCLVEKLNRELAYPGTEVKETPK